MTRGWAVIVARIVAAPFMWFFVGLAMLAAGGTMVIRAALRVVEGPSA